jgi:hypothetical protein
MDKDDEDSLINAVLASALMDETASYLARGRAFQTLRPIELQDRWVNAFRRWISSQGDSSEMDDLAAELRLRNMPLPSDRVPQEHKWLRDQMLDADPDEPAVRARVAAFLKTKGEATS